MNTNEDFMDEFQVTQHPVMERRADNQVILMMVRAMHKDVSMLRDDLRKHMTDETDELAEAVASILKRAFPNEDPDGHRKAHEEQMDILQGRAKFWKSISYEVTKYGLFGVLGWLAYTVWTAFLLGPKK